MAEPQLQIPGYTLLRELGAGGMATVYLAIQASLERQVAIKVMRRGGSSEGAEARFLMEGRAMARLPHRNIVGVHDIVQTDELNYIAMEYLPGGTLADHLHDGLSLADAVSVVVQISDALQLAHDNGIVHRDLKPANIIFRDAVTPVLTDFGIARLDQSGANRLTQAGMTLGTPTYMSPEQASDLPTDGRSDQYSLGVLFYEMLTGSPPFEGSSPMTVALAHIQKPPPPLPIDFAWFQGVVDRMLAKNPNDRYPDLRSFSKDLKSLLTGDTKLMKLLRVTPEQSTSEQLMALGFAQSQRVPGVRVTGENTGANTGARKLAASATVVMDSSGRQAATGPGAPTPTPTGPSKVPNRRMPLLVGAIAAALLIGGGGWWYLGRDTGLDPQIRALVTDTLSASDRLVAEGKLVSPPGDNAYERLQTVLQVAPDLPEALERVERIATLLREQAAAELAAGRFDAAQARVDEALAVKPEDINLLSLSKQIAATRGDSERNERIGALLAQAEAADRAGRTVGDGDDTALALIRQAQALNPADARVGERLATLVTGMLAPARDALAAGDLDAADLLLDGLAGHFATEPGWQALQAEVAAARGQAEQRDRLAGLATLARAQIAAGRLAEPAGDNALESLARMRDVAPDAADTAAVAAEIAAPLAIRARAAEDAQQLAEALTLYAQALQATPTDATFAARKADLEGRLGERESQINRELAAARAAIAGRRYLEPVDENALARLDAVLALDADNTEALRLRADLPRLIATAADALVAEGKLDATAQLTAAARQRYAGDTDALARLDAVDVRLAAARDAQKRSRSLATVREQLAKPQLDVAGARGLGTAIAALLAADPGDREARGFRDSLFQRANSLIGAAASSDALTRLEPVVAEIRRTLPAEPGSQALVDRLARQRTVVAERERLALAAVSGELVVEAAPWAEIVSIVDLRTNSQVTLPAQPATPLKLSLREGTYRITLRHPAVRGTRVLVAKIEAKKSTRQAATFPTLNADHFLTRAGFTP